MPDADVIPVIDLGPYFAGEAGALDRAASELRHALTEIGFYSIVNHGVPSALVHEVYRQVARFHARPLDEKLKIKLDKHNVGYLPMMGDTLRTSSWRTSPSTAPPAAVKAMRQTFVQVGSRATCSWTSRCLSMIDDLREGELLVVGEVAGMC